MGLKPVTHWDISSITNWATSSLLKCLQRKIKNKLLSPLSQAYEDSRNPSLRGFNAPWTTWDFASDPFCQNRQSEFLILSQSQVRNINWLIGINSHDIGLCGCREGGQKTAEEVFWMAPLCLHPSFNVNLLSSDCQKVKPSRESLEALLLATESQKEENENLNIFCNFKNNIGNYIKFKNNCCSNFPRLNGCYYFNVTHILI